MENVAKSLIQQTKEHQRQNISLVLGIFTFLSVIVFIMVGPFGSLFFTILGASSLITNIYGTATSKESKGKSVAGIILCVIAGIIFFFMHTRIYGSLFFN
jgi:dolichol kinase